MPRIGRLILVTFLESFATILVERAVYFYSESQLGFSRAENLALALAFGVVYAVSAILSHRLAVRIGEKRLLVLAIVGQLAAHLVLAGGGHNAVVLFIASTAIGGFNGLKWPVVESYISAGQGMSGTARAIGLFSVSWSAAVPLSLAVSGPIIDFWDPGLFLLAGAINLAALVLILPLRPRPLHLPHDHADRPHVDSLARLRGLLHLSRWTMLASYAALWVLAAIMPDIFSTLGYGVGVSTSLSAVVDVMRIAGFVLLWRWSGWHDRVGPLVAAAVVIPAGFFMVVFGPNTAVVLAGEALFGAAAGLLYYGALYYGMVVANASVESGGDHEGLIGLGFALGPAAGLLGVGLQHILGSEAAGMLLGIGPMFIVCTALGLWSLRRTSQAPGC